MRSVLNLATPRVLKNADREGAGNGDQHHAQQQLGQGETAGWPRVAWIFIMPVLGLQPTGRWPVIASKVTG